MEDSLFHILHLAISTSPFHLIVDLSYILGHKEDHLGGNVDGGVNKRNLQYYLLNANGKYSNLTKHHANGRKIEKEKKHKRKKNFKNIHKVIFYIS